MPTLTNDKENDECFSGYLIAPSCIPITMIEKESNISRTIFFILSCFQCRFVVTSKIIFQRFEGGPEDNFFTPSKFSLPDPSFNFYPVPLMNSGWTNGNRAKERYVGHRDSSEKRRDRIVSTEGKNIKSIESKIWREGRETCFPKS